MGFNCERKRKEESKSTTGYRWHGLEISNERWLAKLQRGRCRMDGEEFSPAVTRILRLLLVRNTLLLLRRKQIRGKRYVSSALRVLADESRGRDSAVTQTSDVR